MQKIYFFVLLAFCFCAIFPSHTKGQNCALTASFTTYESRCTATGAIKIRASGGSGSYKYKVTTVNSNFTTSDSITGLSAGTYTIIVNDFVNNCTFTQPGIVVPGLYQDPRFTLTGINVSCDHGNNGSITVNDQQFGRPPFAYSIVPPSTFAVGTSNTSGIFNNLIAGNYSIQLTDSCGGIQTRSVTINDYTWWIDSYSFTKLSCDSAGGSVKVVDSRGNVSTLGGIPGFSYGIVRQPGDTIWSSNAAFSFYLAGATAFDIIAKDACGTIKKGSTVVDFSPSIGPIINAYNKTCNSFSLSLSNLTNLFNANYCLYDSNDVQISCNNTSLFNNLSYGRYCIKAHNACPDTIITRCITVLPPPLSVSNNVSISNKNCTSFSAAITGQVGLTNPQYCLLDSANVMIECNSTGVFNNLTYGSYCINTKDSCRDTTIIRCFTVLQPQPNMPVVITPAYTTCSNFGVVLVGDSLYSPRFCLYDSSGALVSCNNTGIFDSLYFGNYCVNTFDSCYDTTIVRCFSVSAAQVVDDLVVSYSNKTCSTFTVKGSSGNVIHPGYCLYNDVDVVVECNTTGIFNNVPYGTYCLKVQSTCPDTSFTKCFSVSPPAPSVNSSISISNKTCSTFTAKVTGQQNLTTPEYCIYDSNNVQITCNSNGTFNNLPYGSYCIKIVNTCYDTTITRCFVAAATPFHISVNTTKSCSYGYATLGIVATGSSLPISIKVFQPDSTLLLDQSYSSANINIDSIPGIAAGLTYKIVATDNCGNSDSSLTSVVASIASHTPIVIAQCPSAAWQNGSGTIQVTTATNMGVFTIGIIKKDGVVLSPHVTPNTVAAGVFTFNDLGAATYIISYKLNDLCNKFFYDTIVIAPYVYPNLNRSSAHQCDVSGFSVGAVASNGVGPFSYEIIGSTPSSPSIVTPPQPNPVFNIDNGSNYYLIRLRALDACGNAALGDASILPLADYKIEVDSNCFHSSSTLSVDTIYNSTYAWYKKDNYNSTDSSYLGSGYSTYIPFLSAGDTGTYVCHVTVNTGCVKRSYVYNLNGLCYYILPVTINQFSGELANDRTLLKWKTEHEEGVSHYIIERKTDGGIFKPIGRVDVKNNSSDFYNFTDPIPGYGPNYYRLTIVSDKNVDQFSNTVMVNRKQESTVIRVFPNPVSEFLTIVIDGATKHNYRITLLNMVSQVVSETILNTERQNSVKITRNAAMSSGMYILKTIDLTSNEEWVQKVIFL